MQLFSDANGKQYRLPKNHPVDWRISVYPIVVNNKDEILMVIPTWNTLWELPGGGVEVGEMIKDGLVRECFEETGYTIKQIDEHPIYLGEHNFYHRHLKQYFHSVILVYKASLVSKKQNLSIVNTVEKNEIAKIEWVLVKKLSKKNCHPIIWPAIKQVKRSLSKR